RRPSARLRTVITRSPSCSKRGSESSTEAKDTGLTRAAYSLAPRTPLCVPFLDACPARGRAARRRPRFSRAKSRHALRNGACYREEVAMASEDITIEILKNIRDEARETKREFQEKFAAMDQRFDAMDQRFDAMDQRFDAMDQRFDVLEERVDLTSQRLDITNQRLGVVESTLLTLARRQRSMNKLLKATAEVAGVAAAGVSRPDTRPTDLEAAVDRL